MSASHLCGGLIVMSDDLFDPAICRCPHQSRPFRIAFGVVGRFPGLRHESRHGFSVAPELLAAAFSNSRPVLGSRGPLGTHR